MSETAHLYTTARQDLKHVKNSGQYCRLFNKLAKKLSKTITQDLSQDGGILPQLLTEAVLKQESILANSKKDARKNGPEIDKMIAATNMVLHAHSSHHLRLSLKDVTPLLEQICEKAMTYHYLFTHRKHPLEQAQETLACATNTQDTERRNCYQEQPIIEKMVRTTTQNIQIYMSDPGFQLEETRYDQLIKDLVALDKFYHTVIDQKIPVSLKKLDLNILILDTARFRAPSKYRSALHDIGMTFRGHHRALEKLHEQAKSYRQAQKNTVRKLKR